MITLISARGQTVIPKEIRLKYGLSANSRLVWIDEGTSIRIVPLGRGAGKYGLGIAKGMGLTETLLASRAHDRAREKYPRST
jgi:AbrB family looped-hinge helix DNA binding protein